jgi:hypothetical protein
VACVDRFLNRIAPELDLQPDIERLGHGEPDLEWEACSETSFDLAYVYLVYAESDSQLSLRPSPPQPGFAHLATQLNRKHGRDSAPDAANLRYRRTTGRNWRLGQGSHT